MLEIGSFRARQCQGITRRAFVQAGASVPLGLGLGSVLSRGPHAREAAAANAESVAEDVPRSQATPRARSVILVWLWGGPSHIDTFDPKPDAPSEFRGPFKAIPTRVPGVRFSEIVPGLAKRNHLFSIVRSTRFAANHDMRPLTGLGRSAGGHDPNFGSIVMRRRKAPGLPSFISLVPPTTQGHGFKSTAVPGYGAGRFGSAYDPFVASCSAVGRVDLAGLKLLDGLTPKRLADRRGLRAELSSLHRAVDGLATSSWNEQFEDAYRLLASAESHRAFDLATEDEPTRRAYGRTSFGQSLLLGRRLVEAEVPYVQVNWSIGVDGLEEGPNMGWDNHRNGFEQLLSHHGPVFDRGMSALLDDLDARGLLESTLVVACGEMGRTPKINDMGGRDHWATCSTFWAGGGVEGGRIVGATDGKGGEPVTKAVSSRDVGTTIVDLAGIDAPARAELGVLGGGSVVHELFA